MDKQRAQDSGIMGATLKKLEEYLIRQEKMFKAEIRDLVERISRLDKTVAAQSEGIIALERLIKQLDMQKAFMDLTSRFLDCYERVLDEANRSPSLRFQGAADRAAEQAEAGPAHTGYMDGPMESAPQDTGLLHPSGERGGRRYPTRENSLRFRYLLDKAAGRDLAGRDGALLIKEGEPIGEEAAEEIDRQGLMDQLIRYIKIL